MYLQDLFTVIVGRLSNNPMLGELLERIKSLEQIITSHDLREEKPLIIDRDI